MTNPSARRRTAEPKGPQRVAALNSLPRWLNCRLSQRQLAISVCRHRIAVLAKRWMAAAVAHDLAGLLALDIAVDAGHPRVDLVHQQPLAQRLDVLCPMGHARLGGFDPGQA